MRLMRDFFARDVLMVAPELIGKVIATSDRLHTTGCKRVMITELEAYRGEEDQASHARFGKTKRNGVMYEEAGRVYVYLIYGMYWMLNIVTGEIGQPQAILIRGVSLINSKNQKPNSRQNSTTNKTEIEDLLVNGPGRVGRWLQLDRSFYGEDLVTSQRIWLEDSTVKNQDSRIRQTTRIGVAYAGEWASRPWRWVLEKESR